MPGSDAPRSDPKAARPRHRRKDARPGEIVEAGFRVFAAEGFTNARISDIAEAAGVAKGSVYRYFPSKEALFEAVVQSRLAPILDGARADLVTAGGPAVEEGASSATRAEPGGPSSRDLVAALIDRIHDRLIGTDIETLLGIILTEGRHVPSLSEAYHRQSIAHAGAMLSELIARGAGRGELRADALAGFPLVMMAPAIMAVVWRLTFDRVAPVDPATWRAAHKALVLDGLFGPTEAADD